MPDHHIPDFDVTTRSAAETIALGRRIGEQLKPPVLVLLSGDLGAGKTTLTKGLASGLGAAREEEVTSPTFTLVHRYDGAKRAYHIDLYRIEGTHDLETLGIEDVFSEDAVVLIEWPEKAGFHVDWPVLRIALDHVGEESRRCRISDPSKLLQLPLSSIRRPNSPDETSLL